MKNKVLLVLSLVMIFCSVGMAQSENELRSAQVSFIYPVGSGGLNSLNYTNRFSFNILAGMNGGVDGFEMGGIMNFNKGNVRGGQLAGITNITVGETSGLTMSGISSINTQDYKGMALSGISNITLNNLRGAQVSGIFNMAKEVNGLQFSLINCATKSLSGLQFGLINYSKKLGDNEENSRGVQFGLINIVSDTVEAGTPVGLLNFVKNGYYAFELTASDVLYGNLSFKFGTRKFYTILNGGYSQYKGVNMLGMGVGFGTISDFNDKHALAVELISNNLVVDNKWKDTKLNMLNSLNLNYQYKITDHLMVTAGPIINCYVTRDKLDGELGTINVPYTIYNSESEKTKVSTWIGAHAGLIIKL